MRRLLFFKIVFVAVMVLILSRLFYWQVLRSDDLVAMAEDQRVVERQVKPKRGEIKFYDGSTLASNEPSYGLFAQPKLIVDKIRVAEELAQIIAEKLYAGEWKEKEATLVTVEELRQFNKDKESQVKDLKDEILGKVSSELYWVSLGVSVNHDEKQAVEKLNFAGVGFDESSTRFYPEGSSSAHLLGFIGKDGYGEDKGYFGLEGYYDGELRGKKGLITQEKDAHGEPILIGKYIVTAPVAGKTFVLNVDRTMQFILESKLRQGLEKYQARGVAGIVVEPKTGRILAMAAYPNYDPSHYWGFAKDYFKNPITVDGYEPGSTFKVLVMAAALNEGAVTPETVCEVCYGALVEGKYTIRTWNNKYYPNSTMTDVIVHSDNIGMVFAGRKLGLDKLYKYLQDFGLGTLTGVDLEDEYSPPWKKKQEWRDIDLVTASFGQGISVTALQLVMGVASIANGGYLMEPHVVSKIIGEDGVFDIEPRVVKQVISSEVAGQVKDMMVKAVESGEAKFFKPKGYKIAGKTGTAQIPVAGHYDPTKTIASFVGFAPADDPRFVMLIRYDQPTLRIYGAETAAPTFFEIAKEYFNYLNIPPQ